MAMAEQELRWRLLCGQYLGDISALCFLRLPDDVSPLPYLLAGTGSQLLLYNLDEGNIIQSFQVFQGNRVHGISANSTPTNSEGLEFEIAVFGEKRVKLFHLHVEVVSRSENHAPQVSVRLDLLHSVPRLAHWVLDVSFFKYGGECTCEEESRCVAIGCSDNSVLIWDVVSRTVILEVKSPERCLLYSMRLWGDNLKALRIASGTIYNEIIVWKVVPESGAQQHNPLSKTIELQQFKAVHISRLIGHEGSIFRITWSSDGSKLVSVSDDRSAHLWTFGSKQKDSDNQEEFFAGPVLFGHNARVWDCCIFNSLVVTVGEDCTCRVWDLSGKQLLVIKEHIGRGVWRCLYHPSSSLLITAGFDSAIKVHFLPTALPQNLETQSEMKPFMNKMEILSSQIPNSYLQNGLMDSKSEYVRCLHLTCEDTLYVATNNGFVYHAKFLATHVKWTKLVQVSEEVPIICMDLLSKDPTTHSCSVDDWIALGDGKGNMTIVRVKADACNPEADFTYNWSAGNERQLLGTYWCKSLGDRFIFTTDPRGVLKLWRLNDPLGPTSNPSGVSLIAEFVSCFGIRIICLDASFENEVLVCGDLRGNVVLFPLLRSLLLETTAEGAKKLSPLIYFKGAHGISTVSSISVAKLSSNSFEICSTGGDGCICYFEYDREGPSLEFIGMKQVKELSLIQSVLSTDDFSEDLENCGYAVGFASTEFIIWNLKTAAKVVQIPCGGWRRPNSYYLGDIPEMKNCFAYVKDEIIYIHRLWVPESGRKMFPQNLHPQFHGREIHSLCFVSKTTLLEGNGMPDHADSASWIATGCEDGTVRLTRFTPGDESSFASKFLGEHVGGSAVRSICCVSKVYMIASNMINLSDWRNGQNASIECREDPFLLISVGAKRVLTSWLLRDRRLDEEKSPVNQTEDENESERRSSLGESSSMSFKWLSNDMPTKNSSGHGKTGHKTESTHPIKNDANSELSEKEGTDSKTCLFNKSEDDWRFMAVTAFLVRCTGSRLTICFVVVASSDATLALRALVLPHRLWFDVATLVPLPSPVLALQHVIIPMQMPSEENIQIGNIYIVVSGATDGSVAFWDLTDSIEAFMQQLSAIDAEKLINYQTRPRTGRGSQGGRWWRSLSSGLSVRKSGDVSVAKKSREKTKCNSVNNASNRISMSNAKNCETVCSPAMLNASLEKKVNSANALSGTCEIRPLHVLNVHQSGVNCLHVSEIRYCQSSNSVILFSIVSGGDDQALHCLKFEYSPSYMGSNSEIVIPHDLNLGTKSAIIQKSIPSCQSQNKSYSIRCLHHKKIASAHSSATKGVWTDGTWVFSTGLDQRIRCWLMEENGELIEQTYLIISVPEPEALQARACGRNKYEIAVAGRGMQIVEFSAS